MTKLFKISTIVFLMATILSPTSVPATALSDHDKRQIQCLAQNAYFEAGNQSIKGKIAVTNVVMNRVEEKRFPQTP